jgi:S1-C subfamily serine protease
MSFDQTKKDWDIVWAIVFASLIWFVAFLATFVLALAVARADWAPVDMNHQIDSSNFLVNRGCSGTLIEAQELFILTANHCVENQYETIEREKISDEGVVTKEKIRRLRDGTVTKIAFVGSETVQTSTYRVALVGVDQSKDLALLKVRGFSAITGGPAAPIACEEPRRGDTVYIVGNPMGSLYSSVVKGLVSSTQRDYDLLRVDNYDRKQPLLQISGGTIGGNSGGAAYNDKGELIGVPVLAHGLFETLGFAVPLSMVKEFLKTHKLERLFARCNPPKETEPLIVP